MFAADSKVAAERRVLKRKKNWDRRSPAITLRFTEAAANDMGRALNSCP